MANVITSLLPLPGFRMISATHLNNWAGQINNAFSGGSQTTTRTTALDGVTATPSGTQSNSILLTGGINRVATVASAADGVKLPLATPGATIVVINDAATNAMQVFGTAPDTINDVATATGVSQAAGKTAAYNCPVAGKWYRNLSA